MNKRNPNDRAASTDRQAKTAIEPAGRKPSKNAAAGKAELSQTELDGVTGGCCTGTHLPK